MPPVRTALPSNDSRQPALRLFSLFGIQFTANWTWVLLFGLLIYVAFSMFRGQRAAFSSSELIVLALVAAVLAVFSLYAHELAHALVARAFGIPVRTISLLLFGGMTHINRESPTPRAELLIAAAGPSANLALGALAFALGLAFGDVLPHLGALASWLAIINIPLAVFNLLPAFPLDGGRVLRGVLWYAGQDLRWASTVASRVGQVAALGLLFSGVWVLFDGSSGALGGLWLIVIAWFLYAGAVSSHYATLFHDSLRRLTVASVMDRDFGKVQAAVSVQEFADEYLLADGKRSVGVVPPTPLAHGYAVYRDEYLVGLLSLRDLGRIPMQTWPQTSIERAMLPIDAAPAMEPGAPALGALHMILEDGVEQIAVMADGRLLGLVSRTELTRANERP